MHVDATELGIAKKVLWPEETVEGTIKQRRFLPGGSLITPTTVVITDRRLIIINRASLGLRQDYEVVPYTAITDVRLEHGIISSSVFVRVQGFSTDKGFLSGGKKEGEIEGLKNKDAIELADYLNHKIEKRLETQQEFEAKVADNPQRSIDSGLGSYIYCNNCGTKNVSSAKFCRKCGESLSEEKAK